MSGLGTDPRPTAGTRGPEGSVSTSYEGRWFFPGTLPAPVLEAFWSPGPWADASGGRERGWPAPRIDRYLPFAVDFGLKLRQEPDAPARLEFKGRIGDPRRVDLGPGIRVVAGHWVKWSYAGAVIPPVLVAELAGGVDETSVEKRRVLRLLDLGADGTVREVSPEERIHRGVQVELTLVGTPASSEAAWWTLGFEAFPDDAELPESVHGALGSYLDRLGAAGAVLDEAHSATYPEWLLGL
ncbi:MAG: hypothetical protein P8188_04200 [Gemmatimonadota bacterium]